MCYHASMNACDEEPATKSACSVVHGYVESFPVNTQHTLTKQHTNKSFIYNVSNKKKPRAVLVL